MFGSVIYIIVEVIIIIIIVWCLEVVIGFSEGYDVVISRKVIEEVLIVGIGGSCL